MMSRSCKQPHELVRQEEDFYFEDKSEGSASSSSTAVMTSSCSASLSTSPRATPFVETGDNDATAPGCHYSSSSSSLSSSPSSCCCCLPPPRSSSGYFRHGKVSELIHIACNHLRSKYQILIAGQILSFSLSVTGAAQATLYFDCNLSAPTFTVGLFYFGLAFCLIPVYRQGKRKLLKAQQQEEEDDETNKNKKQKKKKQGQHIAISQHDSFHDEVEDIHVEEEGEVAAQEDDDQEDEAGTTAIPQYTFLYFIPLHAPAWRYFPMAVLDVYANYFTVLAFSYTNITSVTLFDALAIPTAMVVSTVFLSRRYTKLHLLGVLACSVGILLNVLQDYEHDRVNDDDGGTGTATTTTTADTTDSSPGQPYYPHKLRGDLFALLGGILFGINNTVGEVAVRSLGGPNEYLGMLGVFATCICAVQSAIFERDDIAEFFNSSGDKSATCSETTAWWVLAAYICSTIICYLGSSRFLQVSEAAFYNLSLLTSDLWSVAFSVVAQHIVPQPLFFAALACILSGVVLYEMAPSPILMEQQQQQGSCSLREMQMQQRKHHYCNKISDDDDDDNDGVGVDHYDPHKTNQPTITKTTLQCWSRHANPQELYIDDDNECDLHLQMGVIDGRAYGNNNSNNNSNFI